MEINKNQNENANLEKKNSNLNNSKLEEKNEKLNYQGNVNNESNNSKCYFETDKELHPMSI